MKAAILFEPGKPFEIREVELDNPRSEEVRVRVAASGLCHSDWHYAVGDLPSKLPVVLGHEAAGVVDAVGEAVTDFVPGDRVITSSLIFCGKCDACLDGRSHACINRPSRSKSDPPRITMDGQPVVQGLWLGAFAEEILVHQNALAKVPDAMPLDRAALLGCSVITGFGSVFNAAQVKADSSVAVIGVGGVGLNLLQAAKLAGARKIIAIDINPAKESLAREFGATDFIQGGDDVVKRTYVASEGGVDYAFEAIGRPETIVQGVRMLKPAGLMTIVGATGLKDTIPLPGVEMIFNEWRVQGTYFGSSPFRRDAPRIARMYLDGRIELDKLVSQRIALEEINEGFQAMLKGDGARNVIIFDGVEGS